MKGVTIAIIACMFFGLAPVFEKTLMQFMTPLALAALRSIGAAIILLFLMEALHKIKEISECTHRDKALILLIVGMVGIFGPIFYLSGLKTTSVANTLLIGRSQALLISIFAFIILKEKITIHQIIGCILMVTGLAVIFSRGFTTGYSPMAGDIFIFIAALIWSASAVLVKKYLCHIPPEVIVSARNMIGGVVLCFISYADITSIPAETNLVFYLAGVCTVIVIGQYLWYMALEHTSAATVGLTSISTPMFGTLFAFAFLGEIIESYQMFGGFLILLGLMSIEVHLSRSDITKLECMIKHHVHFHH